MCRAVKGVRTNLERGQEEGVRYALQWCGPGNTSIVSTGWVFKRPSASYPELLCSGVKIVGLVNESLGSIEPGEQLAVDPCCRTQLHATRTSNAQRCLLPARMQARQLSGWSVVLGHYGCLFQHFIQLLVDKAREVSTAFDIRLTEVVLVVRADGAPLSASAGR
ncbi:hypothetical protein RYA97_05455 [Pseudomonas syringae group sp. 26L6]|uniref:hypothetical protein n=1 Tax=Pseudomonas syringae group sp. 26L6 TaxID=3079591 RepID=UPI0029136A29|nr:hypothetical protein [Pseudomonas syringae group sp. 26L6]MDU8644567.1 hypothetical protein [Pseudomonas syringae group sp. 26L6]